MSYTEELEQALAWYADLRNWKPKADALNPYPPVYMDKGEKARVVLALARNEEVKR